MEAATNPYQPLPDSEAPPLVFAGRQAAFARLHQYLNDPVSDGALAYLGWRLTGKTAFLRQCGAVFDDTLVGVYISLEDEPPQSEAVLISAIVRHTLSALARRDLTLSRLPEQPTYAEDAVLRDWLADSWFPAVWGVIRPHRQLVLLLDDAQLLVGAVRDQRLPPDTFAYWHGLLARQPQLKLVVAIAAEHEPDMLLMEPLADPARMLRLTHLAADEAARMLREPVDGLYTVPDETVTEVQRLTGGQPRWMQRAAFHIFRRWESDPGQTTITPEAVKTLLPTIYVQSEEELSALWESLSDNERLLLTAISALDYENPLRPTSAEAITAWLAETDYPLDMTAVRAGLRGLDYRQIIQHQQGQVTLAAGLMRKWLLENAQLRPRSGQITSGQGLALDRRVLIVAGVALALIALLLVISLGSAPDTNADRTPAPTVTLVGD